MRRCGAPRARRVGMQASRLGNHVFIGSHLCVFYLCVWNSGTGLACKYHEQQTKCVEHLFHFCLHFLVSSVLGVLANIDIKELFLRTLQTFQINH